MGNRRCQWCWRRCHSELFPMMKSPVWAKAIKASADPKRARHYLESLAAAGAGLKTVGFSYEEARILCALLIGLPALSGWLMAHPDAVSLLKPEALQHPRREQGLRREVNEWLIPMLQARDYTGGLARLRQFKQREMLRIA